MVAYYPFNGNANDESGNGNNGSTYGNIALANDRFGKTSSAYSFDGIDDEIKVDNSPKLNFGKAFSISLWLNTKELSEQRYFEILSKENYSNHTGYLVRMDNQDHHKLFFFGNYSSGPTLFNNSVSLDSIKPNKYYHLSTIYNGTTLSFYLNSKLMASQTIMDSIPSNVDPLWFGAKNGAFFFRGVLDDIRIYDRALNTLEIDSLYHEGGLDWQQNETPVAPSGMKFIPAKGYTFPMGSDKVGYEMEHPIHNVSFDYDYFMDSTAVTQQEYFALMPSKSLTAAIGPKYPMMNVSWFDAVKYCNARSKRDGLDTVYNTKTWQCNFNAIGYRLPTEAEWEYACRAGTTTYYYWGNDLTGNETYAWSSHNSPGELQPVATKPANEFGLYDMVGNSYQWINDWYKSDYYSVSPGRNVTGPSTGTYRVVRSHDNHSSVLRSAGRDQRNADYEAYDGTGNAYGFRCVLPLNIPTNWNQ